MKTKKNIDNFSLRYHYVRLFISFILKNIFYKKFTIIDDSAVKSNFPVVYASNHQNALIDALVILSSVKSQLVFFARADIFKNKLVARFLRALKIAPIFRIRDGREAMNLNSESFDLASDILSRNGVIGIFPEGTHNDKEQLLPLKKGLARMVLQAENNFDFNLNVQVVPIGITYSNYIKPRSEVVVKIGKPISFQYLKEVYKTNQQQASLLFNKDLLIALKEVSVTVDSIDEYHSIQRLRELYVNAKFGTKSKLSDTLNNVKDLFLLLDHKIKHNDIEIRQLITKADNFFSQLKKHKIEDSQLENQTDSKLRLSLKFLFLLTTFPVFIVGFFFNFLPFIFPYFFVSRKIKDPQFRSSVYFVLATFLFFPIFYILQFFAINIVFKSQLLFLLTIPLMALSGVFSYFYFQLLTEFIKSLRTLRFKFKNKKLYFSLYNEKISIVNELNDLMK